VSTVNTIMSCNCKHPSVVTGNVLRAESTIRQADNTSVCVDCVQRVEVIRSDVRVDYVFRPANCVTDTHSAVITVTKAIALVTTVSTVM